MTTSADRPLPSRSSVHHAPASPVWYRRWSFWAGLTLLVIAALVIATALGTRDNRVTEQSALQSEEAIVVPEGNEEETQSGPAVDVQEDDQPGESTAGVDSCETALIPARYYAAELRVSEAMARMLLMDEGGDAFTEEAAACALDSLNWDWAENAKVKAVDYSQDPDLTAEDIYELLSSKDGEMFTPEQARQAVEALR
ncbi:Ltp family lipoprotein [Actinomyces minihominis]|uniref:Ltp family lipoprotein n=1 Tax=Actinomyces minihominis TaxID=2002838 RepID=UPI000C08165F|nr:Ltp family lipoprotein [Actinomyces minihominis]